MSSLIRIQRKRGRHHKIADIRKNLDIVQDSHNIYYNLGENEDAWEKGDRGLDERI